MLTLTRLMCLVLLYLPGTNLFSSPFKKAILISVDGLRPDLLQSTPTPHLDALVTNGTFGTALAVRPVKTLPNHASMISGVDPSVHGITWNDYQPEKGVIEVPTIVVQKSNLEAVAL